MVNYETIYTSGTGLEKNFISLGCAPRKKIVLSNPVIEGGEFCLRGAS
jgi:hypothetical protein